MTRGVQSAQLTIVEAEHVVVHPPRGTVRGGHEVEELAKTKGIG